MSHREYADFLAKQGILLGRTCITNSLVPGTLDISPIPSDSICIQHRRKLAADISATDTLIYIDNPLYLDEIACWEGHSKELYMVKIGQDDVESCSQKYEIFRVIRTWEEAHKANAFPQKVLRLLQNPQLNWPLVRNQDPSWTLHRLENGVSCETFHLTPRPSILL